MSKVNTVYAMLTNQGTAAAETALCDDHLRSPYTEQAARAADHDVVRRWVDCTGNNALACTVCGTQATDDTEAER